MRRRGQHPPQAHSHMAWSQTDRPNDRRRGALHPRAHPNTHPGHRTGACIPAHAHWCRTDPYRSIMQTRTYTAPKSASAGQTAPTRPPRTKGHRPTGVPTATVTAAIPTPTAAVRIGRPTRPRTTPDTPPSIQTFRRTGRPTRPRTTPATRSTTDTLNAHLPRALSSSTPRTASLGTSAARKTRPIPLESTNRT